MTSINYIGSKLTLLDWLLENFCLDNVRSFAEPMTGTGIVSATIARLKPECHVFANDLCMYSSILASSRILPFNQELYDRYFALLQAETTATKGFFYANYGAEGSTRLYFTAHNAQRIDGCRILLEQADDLDVNTKTALIATIISGADKVANSASHYCAYLKQVKKTASVPIRFTRFISTEFKFGKVFNGDALNFLAQIPVVDLLYCDPPYTDRGYCSYYHVLETIALYDNPTLRGITGQREDSLPKNGDLYKKGTAQKYMQRLFDAVSKKCRVFVMSYSSDGIVPLEVITAMLSVLGSVEVKSLDYKKYKSRNQTTDKPDENEGSLIEYLVKCSFA